MSTITQWDRQRGDCPKQSRIPRLWHAGIGIGCLAGILLAGCAVGPNFHVPDAPAVKGYTKQPLPENTESADVSGGQAQRFATSRDIPGEWWVLFHSESLNALIEEALKTNPTLQSAQAALRGAMENTRAQQGLYFPTIAAGFSPSRNKNAGQPSPALASSVLLYNLYQAQLNASWTLDVFGANRRQVESLRAQAEAQRFQLEATYLALTANVVAAAVQEASLRAQIVATEEVIQNESDALVIMRRQNASGQIAGVEVAAQEAALAQAQQLLPLLRKQLAQQRDLLTALAGRLPAEEIEETFEFSSLELPEELPVSLPSQLIQQRPDIRIAEENLHAASAQIGVAIANMLPNVTLSAGEGTVATTVGQLFQPGNGFWSIGANLVQPIFDGGTLLHRTRAAEAVYDEAASAYRSTVITAFQNVADTLHALQSDADALKAAAASETAAARSLNIVRRQLDLGQIAYLGLLTAQQTYQQALINRVQAQAGRYADTAALFQALGGGWWNRSDVAMSADVEERAQ
jgi:NodT family efflux transporter outer membrane factor (OMF) lipoprotein